MTAAPSPTPQQDIKTDMPHNDMGTMAAADDCEHEQSEVVGACSDASSNASDTGSDAGSCAGSEGAQKMPSTGRSGRFSEHEQRILVDLIKNDEELCRSFLHRIRARQYEKKSWMHEISQRFNKLSPTKRSLDAVRHHFMLRRSSKDNHSALVWHAMRCRRRKECTKCLLLDRFRVQSGAVRCGVDRCKVCKPGLPHAFDAFDARELLDVIKDGKPVSAKRPRQPATPAGKPDYRKCSPVKAERSGSLPSFGAMGGSEAFAAASGGALAGHGPLLSGGGLPSSQIQTQILLLQRQRLLSQLVGLQQQQLLQQHGEFGDFGAAGLARLSPTSTSSFGSFTGTSQVGVPSLGGLFDPRASVPGSVLSPAAYQLSSLLRDKGALGYGLSPGMELAALKKRRTDYLS